MILPPEIPRNRRSAQPSLIGRAILFILLGALAITIAREFRLGAIPLVLILVGLAYATGWSRALRARRHYSADESRKVLINAINSPRLPEETREEARRRLEELDPS